MGRGGAAQSGASPEVRMCRCERGGDTRVRAHYAGSPPVRAHTRVCSSVGGGHTRVRVSPAGQGARPHAGATRTRGARPERSPGCEGAAGLAHARAPPPGPPSRAGRPGAASCRGAEAVTPREPVEPVPGPVPTRSAPLGGDAPRRGPAASAAATPPPPLGPRRGSPRSPPACAGAWPQHRGKPRQRASSAAGGVARGPGSSDRGSAAVTKSPAIS